jgi:DNA repair protein RadC
MSDTQKAQRNSGHRSRLRERYMQHGLHSLLEHEKLELLLTYLIPRRDTKPIAKALLAEFHSLAGVMAQNSRRLQEIEGMGEITASFITLIKDFAAELLKGKLFEADLLQNTTEAVRYARLKMGSSTVEEMLFIYLNNKGHIIKIENQYGGRARMQPDLNRMVKVIVNEPVTGIIIVHNHPGGSCQPSREDIMFTKQLKDFTRMLQIELLDHIIVTHEQHVSLVAYINSGFKGTKNSKRSGKKDTGIASERGFVYVAE